MHLRNVAAGGLVLVAGATAVLVAAPHISATTPSVTVRGNVQNLVPPGPSVVPIANQSVTVTCGSQTFTLTTDGSGLYTATFSNSGCVPGHAATAETIFNDEDLRGKVHVSDQYTATIDLNF